MEERNLDFDRVVDRHHTNSLKYDFAVNRGKPADVLPFWVADMDFPVSSYIQDALVAQATHGIYGYSDTGSSYYEAVAGWMMGHHRWQIHEEWVLKTPGIVFAIAMAVRAFTQKGDSVLIQQPVYYPFREVIEDNHRIVISNDLKQIEDGSYRIDFDDFEDKIIHHKIKLFLLCSPHNPVGRVWTREELLKISTICLRHGVIVVSDEIHSDFIWEGEHTVFAGLNEETAAITITCTSPSKTFNIAGLQISNIIISNRNLREQLYQQIVQTGYFEPNSAGITACEAAYRYGQEWYEAMMNYLHKNIVYTELFIRENLPQISFHKPQGTYLLWLDFRRLGLTEEEREDLVVKKAGLWLDSGYIFGAAGEGFERINPACPSSVLQVGLDRLKKQSIM